MKGMSKDEKVKHVELKNEERTQIQNKTKTLNVERVKFVAEKKKEIGEEDSQLDKAMITAIHKQAKEKNFNFSK